MKDNVTLDAPGQYRRDLGWKPGRNGGYTQHRFYLGRDHARAQRLCRKLEVLWDDIVTCGATARDCLTERSRFATTAPNTSPRSFSVPDVQSRRGCRQLSTLSGSTEPLVRVLLYPV